jgi:Helix-turn-helix of DDE superfamily endonuclease
MALKKLHPLLRDFTRVVYFKRLATQDQLAKFFGVSQSTIHRIISARNGVPR